MTQEYMACLEECRRISRENSNPTWPFYREECDFVTRAENALPSDNLLPEND